MRQQLTVEQAIEAIGPGWPESCPTCDTAGRHTLLGADDTLDHWWGGGGSLVHTRSGAFGADWDREEVVTLLRDNEERIYYSDPRLTLGHPLVVVRLDRPPLHIQTIEGWAP